MKKDIIVLLWKIPRRIANYSKVKGEFIVMMEM